LLDWLCIFHGGESVKPKGVERDRMRGERGDGDIESCRLEIRRMQGGFLVFGRKMGLAQLLSHFVPTFQLPM